MLHISDTLALPIEAQTETFAILAKRGSGKTYTAKVLVEEMVKAGLPVIVADPIGVWWGLRAGADGVTPGLPVVIFGGDHADVPLEETAGALIADVLIEQRFPAVLDLSGLSKGAGRRFMTDFAERLYHRNREPMHLVLDEADAWAPQRAHDGGQRLLGAIEDLVRRGRARGLGLTLITQRPAVLNKDVLTQCEVLIALRMNGPRDVAAIDEWVRLHADDEEAKALKASLPSLPVGTAWVWSPGWLQILQKVQIRRAETFDSSATPKPGQTRVTPREMAPVDLKLLGERITASIEETRNSDPAALRERVAQLETELKARPVEVKTETRIERVEVPVLAVGEVERLEVQAHDLIAMSKELHSLGAGILNRLEAMGDSNSPESVPVLSVSRPKEPPEKEDFSPPDEPPETPRDAEISSVDVQSGFTLSAAQRRILTVLAHYPKGRNKKQIALLTNYSVNGGSFGATFGEMKRLYWIGGTSAGYFICVEGRKALGVIEPLPTFAALRQKWYSQLNTCEAAILRALCDVHPKSLTKSEIASRTGYEPKGGSFGAAISKLKTLELIEGKTEMKMDDALAGGPK